MINSICQEIEERQSYLEGKAIKTIYFGGGTPSLLTKAELQQILSKVESVFETNQVEEITLEANPDDIKESNLEDWKSVGISRLSIGLQSFKKEDLEWMNRAHTAHEALNCVQLANQFGFDNITADLMYGLPNLSLEEWKAHIRKVIDLGVNHISAYCLTVEEKTALHNWVEKRKIVPASEEQQSEQFLILLEEIQSAGFEQYEISNFAKPNFESKHNSNYWKGEWYLGIGPSAHSFNGKSRSWNVANNRKYINSLRENTQYFETETLTPADQFNEYILTGLRTTYGVEIKKLKEKQTISAKFNQKIREFKDSSWLVEENNTIKLTPQGRLRADFIASELFV